MARKGQRPGKTRPYQPTPEQRRGDRLTAKLDRILKDDIRWAAKNYPRINELAAEIAAELAARTKF